MERVVRISKQVVSKYNLNVTELMLNATIYDFGFDKKGYESFYFSDDNQMLDFMFSVQELRNESAERNNKEFIIG